MLVKWHKYRAGANRTRNGLWKYVGIIALVSGMGAMAQAAPIVISGPEHVDDLTMSSKWKIWGAFTSNYVGYTSGKPYRTALRFDMAGNPALAGVTADQVQSATIVINATLVSGAAAGATYDLYRLKREFVEGDFVKDNPNFSNTQNPWTYFRASGSDANGDKTFTASGDKWTTGGAGDTTNDRYLTVDASFTGPTVVGQTQILNIDVTQYVKDVLNGAADLGWIMQAHDESGTINALIFNSSEDADVGSVPVRLEITTVPEPAAMSLLALSGLLMVRRRRM